MPSDDLSLALEATAAWLRAALGAHPDKDRVPQALRKVSVRCHPDKTSDVRLHEAMMVLRKYYEMDGGKYFLIRWREFLDASTTTSASSSSDPIAPAYSDDAVNPMSAPVAEAFTDRIANMFRASSPSQSAKNVQDFRRCLLKIMTGTHKNESVLRTLLPWRGDPDFVLRFFRSVEDARTTQLGKRKRSDVGNWLDTHVAELQKKRLNDNGYIQTTLQHFYRLGLRDTYVAFMAATAARE